MHGNPELWTTRERWNACDKRRQSVARQNKMSSVGHGLWQRTRRAVSGGISVVCRSRAWLAVWGMAAHDGAAGSGALEVGSPGRAVAEALGRELSAMEGAEVLVSYNGISLPCC